MNIIKVKETNSNKRIIEFDIIRGLACMMVIATHSPMPSSNANGLFLSSLSYLTTPCIGLFFIISGALLLPIQSTSVFLKKRLSKVLIPTIFWSFFYLCIKDFSSNCDIQTFLTHCASIPFTPQGNGVLWFMYTLIGLYLITPIISKWIVQASKKEIEFYLCIWGITLCYPIFTMFLNVDNSVTSVVYYFSGYLGYYILGFYLKKYADKLNFPLIGCGCIIALLLPILCKISAYKVDFYSLFWYLSIFVAIQCVGWYMLIFKLLSKCNIANVLKKYIIDFSNLSFGIYLVHIFIMRSIIWKLEWIINLNSYIFQTFLIFVLTLILSYILCKIISLIPKSEFIIGFRHK